MKKMNLVSRLVWFCAAVAATTILVKFSLAQVGTNSHTNPVQGHASSEAQPKYGTMGFDNTRFFSPRIGEDWVKITAKGKRNFITEINPQRAALVIVDLQKAWTGWCNDLGTVDRKAGDAYYARMTKVVLPNVSRILGLFRQKDMIVIYMMLNSGEIADPIAPSRERLKRKREFVLLKFSAGAFDTSTIDNVLRENGIATILVTGADTAGCVLGTIEGANDRTYQTILVEDACIALRADLHEAVVKIWRCFGFVRNTDQVVDDYPWQNWVDPALRQKKEPVSYSVH